jgi:hypothetical protein
MPAAAVSIRDEFAARSSSINAKKLLVSLGDLMLQDCPPLIGYSQLRLANISDTR